MRDHCHLGSHELGLGEGQAARESVLHLDFTIQPACGDGEVGGRAAQKGDPTLGPLISFSFISQASRPCPPLLVPKDPLPSGSLSLSIHLRISKKDYLKKLG